MEGMQKFLALVVMAGSAVIAGAIGLRMFQMDTRELLLTILVLVLAIAVVGGGLITPVALIALIMGDRDKRRDAPRPAKGQDQTSNLAIAATYLASLPPDQRQTLLGTFGQSQSPQQFIQQSPQQLAPQAPPPVVVAPLKQMKVIGGEENQ